MLTDTTRGNADSAQNESKSIMQSVADTASGLADSASKAATGMQFSALGAKPY